MEKPLWAQRDVFWSLIVSNEVIAMQRHIITSIFLALIFSPVAQGKQTKPAPKPRAQNTASIKVYPARGKRIRIVAGTQRILVDLTKEVSGCLDIVDSYPSKRVYKQPLAVRVIDRVRKDDKDYLVLLAGAQSNCNVNGMCGAVTDRTLIWMKLGADLKLEEKKAEIIENCFSNIYISYPEYDGVDDSPIKLMDGKLTVEYGDTEDDNVRTLSRLVYDRQSPERGFVITTKEKKSKQ